MSTILIWPWLPAWDWWLPLVCLGCLCWRPRPATACLLFGLVWALCYSHWQLSWLQAPDLFQRSQLVAGTVDSVQHRENGASRLIVSLKSLNGQALSPRPRVLLSWYGQSEPPAVGDNIQSISRLQPPHSLLNPGSFNSARWLLGQGITARGYLTGTLGHQAVVASKRTRLARHIGTLTADLPARRWLLALSVGDRSGLQQDDWDMLRGLGVSHLFAISGLHIGLVAGLGLLVGRLSGHRFLAAIAAGGLALGYAWMAGFSVPTQRALLMLLVWLGLFCWGRFWSARRLLLLTMTLLLAAMPWLALDLGFWLSVLAVVALLVSAGWLGGRSLWRLQLGLSLLLLPLIILLFGGISWLSLPVNILLIPLFSLLLIPLLLLACLLVLPAPGLAMAALVLLNALFDPLMAGLHGLNDSLSPWQALSARAQGLWLLLFLLPPVLLLPRGRWLMALAMYLLLLQPGVLKPVVLEQGPEPRWEVRILDVGQGLSVLVTQGRRALLYDTGNRFDSGFNMADGVILPLLTRLGIDELDYLVVSHDDRDHSGNREYLAATLPVHHRRGVWPGGQHCRAGQREQWGILTLQTLWPVVPSGHRNNDSCVLHIGDGSLSLLLTGDIEAEAEQGLLALGQPVAAELLLSPHHGSRSSSSEAFNRAVAPDWVVHTAGYANRWGFPSSEVVARFKQQGVPQLITGEHGMVHLVADGDRWQLLQSRRPGPWYHRLNAWLTTGGRPPKSLE
ncbi:DNA internalization-related competence protein ComEC/Rec2 [Oceanisphaera sp. KMM 10153]|uniref:DNA internalization-related competence protein ComEC/Rec2 n=1 Tax=Oceanisphaera submarina TaxID=3390193 RepID=UPI0039757FF3